MSKPRAVFGLGFTSVMLLLTLLCLHGAQGLSEIKNPLDRIQKDYLALTRRVTARHILLPPSADLALALKQKIRNRVNEDGVYVIDAFEAAAKKFSRNETTNFRGGLIGELVPQGYCRSVELDQACFSVRLGEIEGPLESDYGFHLILVSERTNCPKLDGSKTKLVRDGKVTRLVEGEQIGRPDAKYFSQVLAFLAYAFLFGGILAEILAR